MAFEAVLGADELWIGEMRGVMLRGRRVLVLRLEDGVHAYEDRCAHLGLPLSLGKLEGGVITCLAHRYQYDACSGCGVNPERVRLRAYPVRESDGVIAVDVDADVERAAEERA
jgi:toluene monooxygenase system ferredoxin subunit